MKGYVSRRPMPVLSTLVLCLVLVSAVSTTFAQPVDIPPTWGGELLGSTTADRELVRAPG